MQACPGRVRLADDGAAPDSGGNRPSSLCAMRRRTRMESAIDIRPFEIDDAVPVRDLFIRVNRLLAPPQMKQAFEDYIVTSLKEEIGQISSYYGRKQGGFWVAVEAGKVVGM